MKKAVVHISPLLIVVVYLFLAACNPTRRLTEGQYLLVKNDVILKKTKVDKSQVESYIRQKPNRKLFGFIPFHLFLYNLVNQKKVNERRIMRNKKIDEKNVIRAQKHKKLKKKNKQTFSQWLLNIGEPPVVLDSLMTEKTTGQIKLFLNDKGYFNSKVKDSVVTKRKKAKVYYIIKATKPYRIRNISYSFEDQHLKGFVFEDTAATFIKRGAIYDVDKLQKERDRITYQLRDDGFYYFSKEYIYFSVDSNLDNRQLDINIGFKKYVEQVAGQGDSLIETNHKRYRINKVYIQPDYNPTNPTAPAMDTLRIKDGIYPYIFVYKHNLLFNPKIIVNQLLIRKGELYRISNAEYTYKRLAQLKVFKFINIKFQESDSGKNMLDCYIQLTPVTKQSFTIETEGTNTSDYLGVAGNLVYQNKNTFKGAEALQFKLKGALEAQKSVHESSSNTNQLIPFNTVEFGPEMSLEIPRPLFPFNIFNYSLHANPKTTFISAYDYQRRPDYTRTIANLSFGLTFNENQYKQHTFQPLEINFVKVALSPSFAESLSKSSDLLLLNSFTNHMTTSSRYTFVYNNQEIQKRKDFSYLKINVESSGSILRGVNNLIGSPKDVDGSYHILGVKYSQYLRFDYDYRHYFMLPGQSQLVLRSAVGIGRALTNLTVLPFEKSFWSGGANGMRAWRAMTLGPGAYSGTNEPFDRIGDIKIEANAEYRFNLVKMLNGAAFIDAGNVWLRKPDPNWVGGEFKFDTFASQIAVGAGLGLRVDFSFFIIRLDAGVPLKDPSYPEGQRWQFHNKPIKKTVLNLGIGYPF